MSKAKKTTTTKLRTDNDLNSNGEISYSKNGENEIIRKMESVNIISLRYVIIIRG